MPGQNISSRRLLFPYPRLLGQLRPAFTLLDSLATQYIPEGLRIDGGVLGPKGALLVRVFATGAGAGNKDVRVFLGNISTPGGSLMGYYITANITGAYEFVIHNDGSLTAQIAPPRQLGTGTFSAVYTSAIDTSQPFWVHVGGHKDVATDTLAIRTVTVFLEQGA